ncbi:MAG: hypothetical protein LBK72_04095 [Bifidobacteriaceae bacterium]|jgi:hypothetical protein|nr:hypothetical protein [Bifidobacteriaceae bacterium]
MRNGQRLWVVAAGIIAVALIVVTALGLYLPESNRMAEARASAVTTAAENDLLRVHLADLRADAERLGEFQAQLATLRGQFPTSLELSSFTRYLSGLADAAGLVVQSINVSAPLGVDLLPELPAAPDGTEPPTLPEAPRGLYMYPITLTIAGSLDAAKAYTAALQDETPETRMFLAPNMSWSRQRVEGAEEEMAEVFTIQGMTFALVPADQVPAPEGSEPVEPAGEEPDVDEEATS